MMEEDYYIQDDGRYVFTEHYHLKRGYCCGSGCRHCPFRYENVPEPRRTFLLQTPEKSNEKKNC